MKTGPRKSPGKYIYPFLECDHHEGPQRSYAVCKHVMDIGVDAIKQIDPATDEGMGVIWCESCSTKESGPSVDDFRAVCEGCCKKLGYVPT